MAQGVPGRLRPQIILAFHPRRNPWCSLSEAELTSGHVVLSGVPREKLPVTPPGIDPGNVQLVAQHLNHYAIPGPTGIALYKVSQEEWTKFRESVPYVELYRYNPKHLYPKLNGYGDNSHRKVWASGVSTYCTPSVTPYSSTAHARQRDTAS